MIKSPYPLAVQICGETFSHADRAFKEAILQVWFSHKRRKDKKDQEEAIARAVMAQRNASLETAGDAELAEQDVQPNGTAEAMQIDAPQASNAVVKPAPVADQGIPHPTAPVPQPVPLEIDSTG